MFFIFIVVHKGSTHAFMNFQPRLKFLVDYMGNFNPINRAENLISGSSNRAESSSRTENPHVISPLVSFQYVSYPPRIVRKPFLTRYTVKNGISNLYTLHKSSLKMQEMPFQRPKFQNISGGGEFPDPLQLCRHYGLPLTKILATPLSNLYKNAPLSSAKASFNSNKAQARGQS